MVNQQENELMTRTNAGTPMGEVMRRYWLPAALSTEIPEPDCPPVRIGLLGEKLVIFRDTQGRIGLLSEFCAHRQASLFLGRNEECGLRCVFHGWKYDVEGNCLDMMNESPESNYKDEIKLTAYPTVELAGIIWAYMGPKDRIPPEPKFDFTQAAATHLGVSKNRQECNWLQGLEGGVDTSHVPILHKEFKSQFTKGGYVANSNFAKAGPPKVEVDITDYGYRYVGIRVLSEEEKFVRSYHFVMPFHQIRPALRELGPIMAGHIWVPIDDESSMVWHWSYALEDAAPLTEWKDLDAFARGGPEDWGPDFRGVRNIANDWLIDRQAQKTETFTGIKYLNIQDQAVQESMGPIADRTKDHLAPSDLAIAQLRRMLIQAASTVADGGDPPGVSDTYYKLRAFDRVMPADAQWRDLMLDEMLQI